MRLRDNVLRIIFLLPIFLLHGCKEAVVTEQPVIHQIAVTPSVTGTASAWLSDYIEETGSTLIDLRPLAYPYALEAAEQGTMEAILTGFPPPTDWFATPLVLDAVAIIVHPDNPLRDIRIESVQGLFSGAVSDWEELDGEANPVEVVILLKTDELRATFEAALPLAYDPPSSAVLAPSPEAVFEIVSQSPGAVGYVPFSMVEEEIQQVRVVRINGIRPGPSTIADHTYPVILEILAVSPEEPTGPVRDWIGWIQAGIE